jgi:predicted transposase/invertase (TIGR01784 family)
MQKFLSPKNDVAFKRIFGEERNKDILIHFINDIMNFKGGALVQEVTFLSPILSPEIACKKQSIVDVLCKTASGVQIIIEMQVSPNEGFEKRAQYYAAKAYSKQLDKGGEENGEYHNLKEVIFIAICDYNVFPDKLGYISHHIILDKQSFEHDLKDFSFTFVELPKFPITKIEDLKTITDKWCYFFRYAAKTTEAEIEKIIEEDWVIKRAYDEINRFNWSEAELDAYEWELKRIRDNRAVELYAKRKLLEEGMNRGIVKGMAQGMAQGIVKGMAKGIVKGRAEGKAEGLAEGKAKSTEETALKMLAHGADLEFIATITGLSLEKIRSLKDSMV